MKQTLSPLPFSLLAVVATLLSLPATLPANSAESIDGPWRYTLRKPVDGWQSHDFDDSQWKEGFGGFGEPTTPGSRVSTTWNSKNIWLRRSLEVDRIPAKPALLIHHDENAEVFVNGTQVAAFSGFIMDYKVVPLTEAGGAALREGKNLLAVHCRQTRGGQFIDVHLVDADNVPDLPAPKRPTTPVKSDLITKWGAQVTADNAWQEYPRPQLVRDRWQNLNGYWDYEITSLDDDRPSKWTGKILVPYCLESKLSGVQRLLNPQEALWYHRTFEINEKASDQRILLNFEAVDYRCRVWLNDVEVGGHVGGNNPFSLEITDALRDGQNHLVLRVEDATGGAQLRGKQSLDPRGIWYTRVSGIWQTVWLEQVPQRHIEQLKISNELQWDDTSSPATVSASLRVRSIISGGPADGEQLRVVVRDGDRIVADVKGDSNALAVPLKDPKLWSPARPHLYDLTVTLLDANGATLDQVDSYTGLRKIGRTRDADGHLRFTLNEEVIFHWGTLDQGWWPDGLLTPPSDEAMRYDVEFLKNAGFNMIRKHIKVEPRRYYYHCDRLGMMLWQDQVSGGENPEWTRLKPNPQDAEWKEKDHAQFMRELDTMIDSLENHPSIVVWVPFNEAWGQHRTVEVGKWTIKRDPTRLVNIASGGNFWPVGHVVDAHNYPHPQFSFEPERYDRDYIKVMGEFGGHGWPVRDHLWDNSERNWGYGGLPKSLDEYKDRYHESIRLLAELQLRGVAAGVYTQTTDVEGEINGLMTYDRKVIKIPTAELKQIHQLLFSDG